MGAQGLVAVGVPPQPLWLLYIKIAILVLSLIFLAISAYALSLWPYGAGGMNVFVVRIPVVLPAACKSNSRRRPSGASSSTAAARRLRSGRPSSTSASAP